MDDVANALNDFFKKSRLPVLFAGGGVSAKAGLPTWGTYLTELSAAVFAYDEFTKYQIDQSIQDGAFGDAAAYYMMCRKMPEATKLKALQEPLEKFKSEELTSLVQLPFQSVVTTNFDRSLFAAYAKYKGVSAEEVNIDDPTLDAAVYYEKLYIARIHGRIEVPGLMRLKTDSLAELEKNSSYQRFLEHVFTRRQVLFIGFSFLDPAIRTVLGVVRSSTRSMHGQEHLALIPSNSPSEFVAELEAHSIRRIEYSDEARHAALWGGIAKALVSLSGAQIKQADVREQPFSIAKKYLATAFARSRIGKQREPLAQAVAEGVVSGVIQNSGEIGVSEKELILQLKKDLSLDDDAANSLVAQSIVSLVRAGICRVDQSGEGARYFARKNGISAYDVAISRLTAGGVNRYVLTEKGNDSSSVRLFMNELFSRLLLVRGWELGAAFAARKMPEDVDVSSVSDDIDKNGLSGSDVRGVTRAVENLLARPDDEEAELLAELGRTAFGLELLLEAPHDAIFLRRTLPQRIYFDANVIMPAITPGHPHFELFNETIGSLREAAGTAILDVSLRVYEGFLNEIVSHKQLAREAMNAFGGEGAVWEERSVGLYGSGNVNVFVGAYFNYREAHPDATFGDFLRIAAPYNTESDLRRHLEKLGFQVVRGNQVKMKDSAGILHALEKFYSTKLEGNRKSAVVIQHDASQLAVVNADLEDGVKTMLVSADRGIRFALEYEGYAGISNAMLTHLGLAQLVELLIGRLPASRGLASLLWMSPVSDETNRIRNYLINLGLKEHDAALAMGIGEIVNELSEDAAMELSRRNLSLEPEAQGDKAEVNRTLERYESKFFEKLNAEVEKIRKRGV